jgi:hypothetical protein
LLERRIVSEVFIREPSKVLLQYLGANQRVSATERYWIDVGCLSMALEIVTQIKAIESLAVTSDLGRAEAISALDTLLVDMQLKELAHEWYERLNRWRQPFFELESERAPIAGAGALSSRGPQSSDIASAPAAPLGTPSPPDGLRRLLEERRRSGLDGELDPESDGDDASRDAEPSQP